MVNAFDQFTAFHKTAVIEKMSAAEQLGGDWGDSDEAPPRKKPQNAEATSLDSATISGGAPSSNTIKKESGATHSRRLKRRKLRLLTQGWKRVRIDQMTHDPLSS